MAWKRTITWTRPNTGVSFEYFNSSLLTYIKNNFTNAIPFIIVNQLVRIVANAALRIVVLITPNVLPTKYIGMKILVAGSNTVKVNIALAPPTKNNSKNSQ